MTFRDICDNGKKVSMSMYLWTVALTAAFLVFIRFSTARPSTFFTRPLHQRPSDQWTETAHCIREYWSSVVRLPQYAETML
ncbi:hypothetical protein FOPE_04890 [Fonsecaea pedrosoi]|nr:hypothetical protein FOPE_04890 [Fonsecaea pedrosoi]